MAALVGILLIAAIRYLTTRSGDPAGPPTVADSGSPVAAGTSPSARPGPDCATVTVGASS